MPRGLRDLLWFLAFLAVAAVIAVPLVRRALDDDGPPADELDTTSLTSAPPAEGGILPLLGTVGDVPVRPALAVKIDTTQRARPQVGLGQADVVYEEVVEGGLTRLLALFHSQDPVTVGPVRSARSTDILVLSEVGQPLFAWSGANETFAAAVRAADVIDVGFDALPGAYHRDRDRRAPVNLFADTAALRARTPAGAQAPPALFQYRPVGETVTGPGARGVSRFRGGGSGVTTRIGWEWDPAGHGWRRTQDGTPHLVDGGNQILATNVVVRFTPYHDTGLTDVRGAPVPEAGMVGEGDVWVLSGGQLVEGRWRKPSADQPTTYVDRAGAALRLAPGTTWVEVLPPGSGSVE